MNRILVWWVYKLFGGQEDEMMFNAVSTYFKNTNYVTKIEIA